MKIRHASAPKRKPVYALLLLFPWPTQAQADATLLDEVVVSGARTATPLAETPLAIGVVKKDTLERDKPKTLGEVINRIPGVFWNDLGNEQHSMAIRQPIGTGALYQYLEDGIPIRPLGVFNHNSLNEMNLAGAEAVEVVKGPASSLYGSNAVGGAINLLTAAPSRAPYAMAGVRRENITGFTRYDTAASNTWGDLGLRFSHYSARRESRNWQDYSSGDKNSFTLRGDYLLSGTSMLRATLVHTDLDTQMTGSLFETEYQNDPGKSMNTFTFRKDRAWRANLAWEGETVADGLTTVTLFWRNNDHAQLPSYTIRGCASGTCGTRNNNHVDSLGVDLKHQQEFAWLASRLVAGVYLDHSNNPYVSDNLRITRDPLTGIYTSYTLASDLDPRGVRDYETGIRNLALFAQWEFSPLERLRVVVGGRDDRIDYDFRNRLAPNGSADYGAADERRGFHRFSPKLGATWALARDAGVYVNFSQGFTPPEVSQLYGKSAVPDLKPASFDNFELGLRAGLLDGALKFDAALYRLDGRDTIVSYTLAPGNSENRNAGRTRSQGLELGLGYDAGRVDARLSATVARHRFLEYTASPTLDYAGKAMPQAPHLIASAELGYRPVAGVRLALEVVRLSGYWMNNANTVRYPGHTLVNLRGSYRLARGWDAWLHLRNLTDPHYADSASSSFSGVGSYSPNTQNQYTPGAPRAVMLGLAYAFDAGTR